MTHEDFNKLVDEQCEKIKKVLVKKQDEYNLDPDRLSFFKHNAEFLGTTPEFALWAMASKHFISLTDMINSDKTYSEAAVNEKITDAANYLILLKGLMIDTGKIKKDTK